MGPMWIARRRRMCWSSSALVLLAVVLTGCSSPQDRPVQDVARSFAGAIRVGDGTRACEMLAPASKEELEQSTQQACPDAILEEALPARGPSLVGDTQVFGTAGRVRLGGETLFVARFRSGWKVMAAGCTSPRPGRDVPYECLVKGS